MKQTKLHYRVHKWHCRTHWTITLLAKRFTFLRFLFVYLQWAVQLKHLATKQLMTKDKGRRGMITARGIQHRQTETAHKPVLRTSYLMKVMLHDVIDLHIKFGLLRWSESTPLDIDRMGQNNRFISIITDTVGLGAVSICLSM